MFDRVKVTLAVAAAVALVAAPGCSLTTTVAGQPSVLTSVGHRPGPLDREGPLIDADVAAVDPHGLLDEFLLTLFTQPVQHVRMESVDDVPAYLAGGDYRHGVTEGGFDFRTDEYAYHQLYGFNTLCADGIEYLWDDFDQEWDESGGCTVSGGNQMAAVQASLELTGTVSAGVLTAGLTPDEADVFVRAMRQDHPGFLQPGPLALTEHDGRQYVRLPVVFKALDVGGGARYGMQLFSYAFRAIGERAQTHALLPGTSGASVSQIEAVFYLDPATRLPAYAEILVYEPVDDPTASTGSVSRIEYVWDGAVPRFEPGPPTPVEPTGPSWPAERIPPME
jgi:hypothetical protein